MENQKRILEKTKSFVKNFYETRGKPEYVYHNLQHTREVVDAVVTITNHYHIIDEDCFVLFAAAWFHDIGYFIDPTQHENKGSELAAEFLATLHADDTIIQKVKTCILATKFPQQPKNLLEEILCDADLFHFGTDNFYKRNKLMYEEYNNLHNDKLTKTEWRDQTLTMLEEHKYHTDYCRFLHDRQKVINMKKLKNKKYKDENIADLEDKASAKGSNAETGKNIPKSYHPEKGVETMFRISSNNHSRLSDMADNKAHILITVNSIILSAIISLVFRKLDNNSFLILPSCILLSVSLTTMIFSILATRPSIPNGRFSQSAIDEKKVNLLFFGNYYKMSLSQYTDAMLKVMNDHDFLYGNLITDVYTEGTVLGKKYRLLRAAYTIFMIGLTISVIAFIITSAMAKSGHFALPTSLNF